MAVNKHFHTSGVAAITSEQNLYADLVAEAIQIHGHDVSQSRSTTRVLYIHLNLCLSIELR